ncbi:MAG: hypothetical protein A2X36_02525 [Elusimicrobia bacterium GWA2_69_24]|nr:MAG: hypothetical protein A2W08_03690 [Candidatus Rokubacteria bacterium RBG_16_73_20]OGR60917.1 MAG: hypothetical protein A2X36_02525 [Elusimicrobia bacterium GWA2_69_24]HBH00736.1 3-hydroxyacyl-[acyl-carrier-protein] dehydratase FabZ [Candidatus Rokubacteria bacterium]
MRFVFVDRVLDLEPGRAIETIKSVSASEDVFADHFPGFPILPGALIVEAFDQAARLLIAESHGFMRGGRLVRLTRAAFRRFVRPGDQLRVRCERRGEGWTVVAGATVDGERVATATLEYALEDGPADGFAGLARELRSVPAALARRVPA